jgi:hypothetical protein
MALQIQNNLTIGRPGKRGRSRRYSRSTYRTSGGDRGVTFVGVQNLRFRAGNGYRTTLGFGGGSWYFKLWDSTGTQVGTTKIRSTLEVLIAVVNADATLSTYVEAVLESGVTSVTGNTSLNFADATVMSGGV